MPRIALVQGDITRQDADAIVNAANSSMRPGGGVDGAITRAAGPEALEERLAIAAQLGRPALPTGTAIATPGGRLAARWIIHTAGPVYSGSEQDPKLLASCHAESLVVADRLGAQTVAFPAISCGIYGYPADEAAPVALGTVRSADTSVAEVRFVLFDRATFDVFSRALGSLDA
jgi:O-acetyl-ADP-ribose deacetylase (regulator of RNase III)